MRRWECGLHRTPGHSILAIRLLTGFDLGRDETHLIHASSVDLINYLGDVGKGEVFITL